ncbi:MAG: sulfite exporter TauE/SafE family protein [Candidatus Brocadiia bacterium]
MFTYPAYLLVGLAAGFSSALLGIGGGVVMVPMLMLIFALPPKAATATSLAYIAPIALYGAMKQWHMGMDLRWLLVALAVPAGLLGAELGSRLKAHISDAHLRLVFAALMIVVGVRIGYRGWRQLHQPPGGNDEPAISRPAPPANQ